MATKVLTSSQLTFVDITDQRKLSAYLTSNLITVQTLDNMVYNPSWDKTNLVIVPQVFIDQTPLDLSNVTTTWKRKDGNNTETELKTGEVASNNILTVNANNLGTTTSGMLTYICYITYTDPETKQSVNITDQMTYTLIRAAENAKSCFISGPQVFKYDSSGVCTSNTQITLTASVQNVSIVKWQYYNSIDNQYQDYPTTTENANITSSMLYVTNAHQIFDSAGVAKIKLLTSDADVYDIITITKLYDGTNGAPGEPGSPGTPGAPAYTVLLDNESHTFPGTEFVAKDSEVTIEVSAYQGATPITPVIRAVDGLGISQNKQFSTQTNGLECIVNGPYITFIATGILNQESGTIPIDIVVDGISFIKVFSWSIAYTGKPGTGACSVSIEASSQIFKSTNGTDYTPNAITLTPHVQNLSLDNTTWKYSRNGGLNWEDITNHTVSNNNVYYNNTTKVLTIPKEFTGYTADVTSIVFRCVNEQYTDSVTIAKLADGQSASAAYTIILSNEMQGIATNNSLVPLDSNNFECAVTVYEGSSQLTPTTGTVGEGMFKVLLPSNPPGITLTQPVPGEIHCEVSGDTPILSSGTIDLVVQIESETNSLVKSISYAAFTSGDDGIPAITFKVWTPNGDVFSNQSGVLPLEVIALEGAININNNATYQWYKYTTNGYQLISGATGQAYEVKGEDVVNIQTYKCTMTYNGQEYSDVCTITDKSDTYVSEMLTVGGTTFKNGQGGSAVYVIVRANGVEKDPFPENCTIGITAPLNPVNGAYWWQIANNDAKLMQYNGTSWAEATRNPQQFTYVWSLMDKDGNSMEFNKTGKVIYLSCDDIHSIGTLQCDVRND